MPLADDAIQVMSIPQGKRPSVSIRLLCRVLAGNRVGDDSRLMLWLERPRFQPTLGSSARAHSCDRRRHKDTIYSYLKGIDARKAEYEGGRMLYVAATRAKNELHLLGHTTWEGKGRRTGTQSAAEQFRCCGGCGRWAEPLFQQAAREVAVPVAAAEATSARDHNDWSGLPKGGLCRHLPQGPLSARSARKLMKEKPVSFYWVGNTLRQRSHSFRRPSRQAVLANALQALVDDS